MNCLVCGTQMKDLFTGTFCPNDCDRTPTTTVTKWKCPPELIRVAFVVSTLGNMFAVYCVEPPAKECDGKKLPPGSSMFFAPTTPTGYVDLLQLKDTVHEAQQYWVSGNPFGIVTPEIGASFVGASKVQKNCLVFVPEQT